MYFLQPIYAYAPDIDWDSMTTSRSTYPSQLNRYFINIIQELSLEQIVNFPTRLDNILDIILTTNSSLIDKCKPLPGFSDHNIVLVYNENPSNETKSPQRKIYMWKSAKLEDLRNNINNKLSTFMNVQNQSVDDMWNSFKTILLTTIEESVPSKLFTTNSPVDNY